MNVVPSGDYASDSLYGRLEQAMVTAIRTKCKDGEVGVFDDGLLPAVKLDSWEDAAPAIEFRQVDRLTSTLLRLNTLRNTIGADRLVVRLNAYAVYVGYAVDARADATPDNEKEFVKTVTRARNAPRAMVSIDFEISSGDKRDSIYVIFAAHGMLEDVAPWLGNRGHNMHLFSGATTEEAPVVKVARRSDAKTPVPGSTVAGYALYAMHHVSICPDQWGHVDTGLVVIVPDGYRGCIVPNTLPYYIIVNGTAPVAKNCASPLVVNLFNTSDALFTLEPGVEFATIYFEKVAALPVVEAGFDDPDFRYL